MGDRVRFLTNTFTSPPSASSGGSGFPFPINGGTVGGKIAVSFADCMKWWWRVKNWSLSTDLEIVDHASNVFTMPNGALTVGGPNATRELALINPVPHIFDAQDGVKTNFELSLMGSAGTQIIRDSGSYYPDIVGGGFVGNDPGQGILTFLFDFSGSPPAPTITGTIDGHNMDITYDTTSFPPASFTFSYFDLTPVEYWPYASASGSAIYNTSTGAQIQSPLA